MLYVASLGRSSGASVRRESDEPRDATYRTQGSDRSRCRRRRLRLPVRQPAGPRAAAHQARGGRAPDRADGARVAGDACRDPDRRRGRQRRRRGHGAQGRDGHPRLGVQAGGRQAQGDRAGGGREGRVPGGCHRRLRGHRDGGGRLQERRDRQLLRPELPDRQGQDVQVPVRQQPHALPDGRRRRPLRRCRRRWARSGTCSPTTTRGRRCSSARTRWWPSRSAPSGRASRGRRSAPATSCRSCPRSPRPRPTWSSSRRGRPTRWRAPSRCRSSAWPSSRRSSTPSPS